MLTECCQILVKNDNFAFCVETIEFSLFERFIVKASKATKVLRLNHFISLGFALHVSKIKVRQNLLKISAQISH